MTTTEAPAESLPLASAPPPDQASAPAGTSEAPPRKGRLKRVALWIGVAVLALVLACGGVFVWVVMDSASEEETFKAADEHWQAAMEAMEAIEKVSDNVADSEAKDAIAKLPEWNVSIEKMVPVAKKELDEAEKEAKRLSSDTVRKPYLEAISEARGALDEADKARPLMDELKRLYEGSIAVRDNFDRGLDQVNDGCDRVGDSAGGRKWDEGIQLYTQALATYDEVGRLLDEMTAIVPEGSGGDCAEDINLARTMLAAWRLVAQRGLEGSQAGKRGISRYNATVDPYNQATRATRDVEEPYFLSDATIFNVDALAQLDKAQTSVDEALSLYNKAYNAFVDEYN